RTSGHSRDRVAGDGEPHAAPHAPASCDRSLPRAVCSEPRSGLCNVRGRILRHEFSHALRLRTGLQTHYQNEEDAADFLAGRLDALTDIDVTLGRLVFFEIGCVGETCTHATPSCRAAIYEH